jgi:DNA-binding NarL/FixJ family response regulator
MQDVDFKVQVSGDRMKVRVCASPAASNTQLDVKALVTALQARKMVCQVNLPRLEEAVKKFNAEHAPIDLVVGQGTPPKPGRPGRIVWAEDFFGEERLREDGSVDFYRWSSVIVCTCHSDKAMVVEYAKLGVRNYLVKPFKKDALLEKVQQVMR